MEIFSKQNKILFRYFIFFFWLIVLIINWNEISWIFNYRVISGFVSGFFEKLSIGSVRQEKVNLENLEYTEKENSLEIPKFGIFAPLVFSQSSENSVLNKLLDKGVVHYPGSVLPGETGQTIILGHSAPSGWPKIKYDWVFSKIDQLAEGDEIFIYFNHRKYRYLVTRNLLLNRGEEIPPQGLTNSQNQLVLISCWPPGKDSRRIAVEAEIYNKP